MQRLIWSIVATAGMVLASGCGGSNSNNNNNGGGNVMQPLGNSIQAIANQNPDDASLNVTDPAALRQSLFAAFGQPDDESVVIPDDQTLAQTVN